MLQVLVGMFSVVNLTILRYLCKKKKIPCPSVYCKTVWIGGLPPPVERVIVCLKLILKQLADCFDASLCK